MCPSRTASGKLKNIPVVGVENKSLLKLVREIIEKQKVERDYDYMSNEQKKIDTIVYEMYGVDENDKCEIETWYARRYPKLARFSDNNQTERLKNASFAQVSQ